MSLPDNVVNVGSGGADIILQADLAKVVITLKDPLSYLPPGMPITALRNVALPVLPALPAAFFLAVLTSTLAGIHSKLSSRFDERT